MSYSVAVATQMQGFLELAHDLLERAAHAIELDIGAAPEAMLVPH
jgi:hypothetical protein